MRIALTWFVIPLAAARLAGAQLPLGPSVSVGLGGGLAGASSSDKKIGPVVTGSVDIPVAPLVSIGAQADYWRRASVNALFATGVVTLHVPGTPLSLKAGGGFGRGDFGGGALSGPSGQLGLVYEILGVGPVATRLFANAFAANGSPSNVVLVDAGLALTWR